MTDDRKGGIALITANILLFSTMALHPTGHQLLSAGEHFHFVALLVLVAHSLAEVSVPIFFLGALTLTRRLAAPDRLAVAGLVTYAFSLIAGMVAAAASGFIAPAVATRIAGTTGSVKELWEAVFAYNGAVNQAFAQILVVASSAAIILWSVAIVRTRMLPRLAGIYGVIASSVLLVAVAAGFLKLGTHGFGAVVLVQGVWFVVVGAAMMKETGEAGPSSRA
jgi:hypothetical protein